MSVVSSAVRRFMLVVWLGACACMCGAAVAPPVAVSAGNVVQASSGLVSPHAWVAIPAAKGQGGVLMHMPPRAGLNRTAAGTIKRVVDLPIIPERMAAAGDKVFLVMPPATIAGPDGRPRRTRSVVSYRAALTGPAAWDIYPLPTGRSEFALPGEGELVDVVAFGDGLLALFAPVAGDVAANAWRVMHLTETGWGEVAWPRVMMSAMVWARLVPGGEGGPPALLIAGEDDAPARLLTMSIDLSQLGEPREIVRDATNQVPVSRLSWADEGMTVRLPSVPVQQIGLHPSRGGLIATIQVGERVQAWVLSNDAPLRLLDAPAPFGLGAQMVLGGVERIVAIGVGLPADAVPGQSSEQATAMRKISVYEWSALTGMQLFVGEARREGPLSLRDVQMVAIALGILAGAALLFVARAENVHTVLLPAGTSLATPTRRLIGAAIDLAAAYLIAQQVTGVQGSRMMVAGAGQDALNAMAVLVPTTLAIAALHGAIGEWMTGRSLGKFITGCIVVPGRTLTGDARRDELLKLAARTRDRAQSDGEVTGVPAITLRQALVRNVVRWLPPLAAMTLLDSNFRHAGDVLAGTVVVLPDEPESEESP